MPVALRELSEVYGFKKALLVTDGDLFRNGIVNPVEDILRKENIRTAEFFGTSGKSSFEEAESGLPKMLEMEPDVIVGVGGGSVMSMAKIMWLLYENPELDLEKMADEHGELPDAETEPPVTGRKSKLVLAATTTGTGSECSPFAAAVDSKGRKRLIASYDLIPEIAVIDADYTGALPDSMTKDCGRNTFVRAVETCLDEGVSDYSKGFAADAVRLVLKALPEALKPGSAGVLAKEDLATASALAGIAMANSLKAADPDIDAEGRIKDLLDVSTSEKRRVLTELARFTGFSGSDEEALSAWIKAVDIIEIL